MSVRSTRYDLRVDQVAEDDWNVLLGRFADASVYQTWAYGAVSWGERQLSHLVLFRDGVPAALAQVRLATVPLAGAGIAYVRWGPVCTPVGGTLDPEVWRAAAKALTDEYVGRRGLTLRVLPAVFQQDACGVAVEDAASRLGWVQVRSARTYQTLRLDIRPPLETLRSGLAHKWRNQLNGAERNQLEIAEGTTPELFDEFRALYDEMMSRKQFDTTVDVAQFARIQARLRESQKLVVLVARQSGRAVSGLVGSAVGGTGIYLLGATGTEGMKAKGAYLLQWRFIARLKERGCTSYDLGGVNPEANPGVYHFKQGLGGAEAWHVGRFDARGRWPSRAAARLADAVAELRTRRQAAARAKASQPESPAQPS